MKQNFTFILLLLLVTISYSQVVFTTIPLDKQLVGRDLSTNLGQVVIEGNVNNNSVNYTSIEVDVLRNNSVINTVSSSLNYASGIASFNFDISITAELANYSFNIYGKTGSSRTLEEEVDDVVAGDVYIIQGQSNAEAPQRDTESASAFNSNFIRVYANGTNSSNTSNLPNDNEWYIGQGDGNRSSSGNTGQWGLKFAKSIVDNINIPVAIFNGAHAGKEINFFQAPSNYQTSISANYGRMYLRLDKTNLKNYVRGIFWAQGEKDSDDGFETPTNVYKSEFLTLRTSWLTDYPNIEQFYIFQTKNGCDKGIEFVMQVKEAQRQLASENADIQILASSAIPHFSDNCHFLFENGYRVFADRLFALVERDLYGVTTNIEIDSPMIISAYKSGAAEITIDTDANSLSTVINNTNSSAELKNNFELANAGNATITNLAISQNSIIFSLSQDPGMNVEISYKGQDAPPSGTPAANENFIVNTNNLELLSFNKYPVEESNTLSVGTNVESNIKMLAYPNPAKDILFVKLPDTESNLQVELINVLGMIVIDKQFNSNSFQLNIPATNGVYILNVTSNRKVYTKKILVN